MRRDRIATNGGIALKPPFLHPSLGEGLMKHYRVNKVAEPDGQILKKKDILASDDREAMRRAEADDDCPICDVYLGGAKVGSIN